MEILSVLALAFLAGACTLLGGFASLIMRIGRRTTHFSMTASTGILLSVMMLGLLPRSLELAGVGYTALGFILGGIVIIIAGTQFPHTYGAEKYEDRLYSLLKTGTLVIYGLIIYNLPAGLLIGSGFAASAGLGLAALVAVVLQNIPRGMAMNVPLSRTGMLRSRVYMIMLVSALPAAIGAGIAFGALAAAVPALLGSGIAFSSGALLFVVAEQLVPIVKGYSKVHETTIALFLGIFVGVLVLGIGI